MSEWVQLFCFLSLSGVSIAQSILLGRLNRRLWDQEIRCQRIRTESCEICGGSGCPFTGKQSNANSFSPPCSPVSKLTETTDGSPVEEINEVSRGRSLYPGNETDKTSTL